MAEFRNIDKVRDSVESLEAIAFKLAVERRDEARRGLYQKASPLLAYLLRRANDLEYSEAALAIVRNLRIDLKDLRQGADAVRDHDNVVRGLSLLRSSRVFSLGYRQNKN